MDTDSKRERWTEAEVQQLISLVELAKKTTDDRIKIEDWRKISTIIKGKSALQCQSKWYRLKVDLEEDILQKRRQTFNLGMQSPFAARPVSPPTTKRDKWNDSITFIPALAKRKIPESTSVTPKKKTKPEEKAATSSQQDNSQVAERKEAMQFFETLLNDFLKLTHGQRLQFKIEVLSLLRQLPEDVL